jgi:putative acetyltransferase
MISIMLIRKSTLSDQEHIAVFIKETIQTINLGDYSEEHVLIWSDAISPDMLRDRFAFVIQYVAEADGQIVGVGDIRTDKEEVDFLYVHKQYIGKGIGSALLEKLEEEALKHELKELNVTSSITAKPFFERRGFIVKNEYVKTMSGKDFVVYSMKKTLLP